MLDILKKKFNGFMIVWFILITIQFFYNCFIDSFGIGLRNLIFVIFLSIMFKYGNLENE